jgi:cell division protein FtsA
MARKSRLVSGNYAVLDVGTSKVACFIAQIDNAGQIGIRGIGHQLSKGIRASVITDFADAETSIIAAVHAAEQMAGETVENVIVSLAGGGLASRSVTVEMNLMGEEVTERDILDLIEQGRSSAEAHDAEIIHCVPTSYYLDNARGIADPRRMFGQKLGVELHVLTAPVNVTRNLAHCIARCHLNVEEFVIASHASAMSCLEEDEMQLGVTLVDMGGGATGFSIFHGGKNVFSDVVPLGGMHVTSDLARGLSTTIAHAERLKTLHGSCVATANDDHVMISVPLLGEDHEGDESNVMPRSMLVGVIRPRMEEIFEMIRGRIESSGMEHLAGRRVVLTGGASQLLGVRDLAARVLTKQVRLAKPRTMPGLADAVSGPAFAAPLGMLGYILKKPLEERLLETARSRGGISARLRGVGNWFRENF